MTKLKHTRIGIISFIVSLIPIVYMAIQFMIDYNVPPEKNITSNITYSHIMPLFLFIFSCIALILGIIGLSEKGSRKAFPVISVIISGLIVLFFMLGFFI